MEPKIEQWILQLPEAKRKLALMLRDIMLGASKKLSESIKWGNLTFVYKGNIAFIYTYKTVPYINLGFMKATGLRNPKGLLEGTGKGMRHLKIQTEKDINKKQITTWVKEAMLLNEGEE